MRLLYVDHDHAETLLVRKTGSYIRQTGSERGKSNKDDVWITHSFKYEGVV